MHPRPSRRLLRPTAGRAWLAVALAALGACGIAWALQAALQVRFPYELDYGEGPLLGQVHLLLAGRSIYPGAHPPYTVGNYPPVYPAVVALAHLALAHVFGLLVPGPGPGRAVSSAAVLAAAVLFSLTVRTLGAGDASAALAGLLLLAQPYVWRWGSLQRVDSLALAWTAAGMYAAARRPDHAARAWPWFALAALTRQDAVEGLLATAWFLWPARRVEALRLLLWTGAALSAATAALEAATRGQFLVHIVLDNVNAWSPAMLGSGVGSWLEAGGAPLIAFAVWGWRLSGALPGDAPRLLRGYAAAAGAVALTSGKVGASINYFLPPIAAACMLAGLTLRAPRRTLAAGLLAAYALGVPPAGDWTGPAGAAARLLAGPRGTVAPGPTAASVLRGRDPAQAELTALLRHSPGPILSENMTDLVLAGHPIYFQPFEMTQLYAEGRWSDAGLVATAARGGFPLVVLQFPLSDRASWDLQRWPANLLECLAAHYRLREQLGPYSVYAPAGGPGP